MTQRTICRILTFFALALVSAIIALAQSSTTFETLDDPAPPEIHEITANNGWAVAHTWQLAQQIGPSKGKLFVVTLDQPNRRRTCRIQSFTVDKLVCSRGIGGSRTYLPQQVLALILPGDDGLTFRVWLGLNGGLATAIWGTVVLAAACPACAAATAFAALVCFSFAGAIAYTDDQPDRLLYLAPGQELSRKLGYVQS